VFKIVSSEEKAEILSRLSAGSERSVAATKPFRPPKSAKPHPSTPTTTTTTTDPSHSNETVETGTVPGYENIIVPKNIIRDIFSRDSDKKSTFMATIMGVVPPDPSKCLNSNQIDAEGNPKVALSVSRKTQPQQNANANPGKKTSDTNTSTNVQQQGQSPRANKGTTNTKSTWGSPKPVVKTKSDSSVKKTNRASLSKRISGNRPNPAPALPGKTKSGEGINKRKS
jgi:hypothetical protein